MVLSPSESRALVSPQIDFWLVGGASITFLFVLWIAAYYFKVDFRTGLPVVFLYASFIVNYPHFAFSYQLFYADFIKYLRSPETTQGSKIRLVIAGIIVPAMMVAYFIYIASTQNMVHFGYAANAFWFFVGWHYVKQGYGVLITLSVYKKIFYSLWQKRLLLVNAYLVWIHIWMETNKLMTPDHFYGLPFTTLTVPDWLPPLAQGAALVSGLLAGGAILYNWLIKNKGIAINGLVGYIAALYIWWPILQTKTIFLFAIPFFHSLQYLPFVYRLEKGKVREREKMKVERPVLKSLIFFMFGGALLGALFMDFVPRQMDLFYGEWQANLGRSFFLISFLIFINVHHYFIDSAFWRKDNATVQRLLFSS